MAKSVLFIDDDETFLYLLERAAAKVETIFETNVAKNGKEALEKLRILQKNGEKIPDLMFVDVNMPIMDGFEFLTKFKSEREEFQELKKVSSIFMLTSSQHGSDKEKVLETEIVQEYIMKPAGAKNIEKMLRTLIP